MREILFRGKRVDNEHEWVYGSLLNPYRKKPLIAHYENGQEILGYTVEVISDTVGQYTGLKDKNSTRIFEGDIIKSIALKRTLMTRYVVEFEKGSYGLRPFGKGKLIPIMRHWNFNENEIEVIGNIYDNPELLEGGNNNGKAS